MKEVTITEDQIQAEKAQQNAQRQQSARNQQAIQGAGAVPQPTPQASYPIATAKPSASSAHTLTRLGLRPIMILSSNQATLGTQ